MKKKCKKFKDYMENAVYMWPSDEYMWAAIKMLNDLEERIHKLENNKK